MVGIYSLFFFFFFVFSFFFLNSQVSMNVGTKSKQELLATYINSFKKKNKGNTRLKKYMSNCNRQNRWMKLNNR